MRIEGLNDLGKVGQGPGQAINLIDNDRIDEPRIYVGQKPLQRGTVEIAAGIGWIVIKGGDDDPALMPLALDIGLTSFALRIEGVELLLKPLFG